LHRQGINGVGVGVATSLVGCHCACGRNRSIRSSRFITGSCLPVLLVCSDGISKQPVRKRRHGPRDRQLPAGETQPAGACTRTAVVAICAATKNRVRVCSGGSRSYSTPGAACKHRLQAQEGRRHNRRSSLLRRSSHCCLRTASPCSCTNSRRVSVGAQLQAAQQRRQEAAGACATDRLKVWNSTGRQQCQLQRRPVPLLLRLLLPRLLLAVLRV
jgi:hypothetical protein